MTDDKDLTPLTIDLSSSDKLNESWLRMFGTAVKAILGSMFGDISIPVKVRGRATDVTSFARTLGNEKRYLETYRKYGLDNPSTYRNKLKLDQSVSDFERKTGLQWPFK